jgi:tRNA 2-selenouridine synthase
MLPKPGHEMALAPRPWEDDSGQLREISRDSKSAAMQDFSCFDLIIDARTEKEYREDHIPGAINLPVVHTDEFAHVGTLHRTDTHAAYQLGVTYSLRNIATYIEQAIIGLPRKTRILVYCWRGGKRSKLWFDALDTIGYQVQKLPGGWRAYRHWVNSELGEVPGRFRYHVLCGPTGCGKTRLLHALRDAGAQVLDLEALASHRGSVIGGIPGVEQPTQKFFDTLLLRELMRLDAGLPIWIEAEVKESVQSSCLRCFSLRCIRRLASEWGHPWRHEWPYGARTTGILKRIPPG